MVDRFVFFDEGWAQTGAASCCAAGLLRIYVESLPRVK
jgi:hypothetical protein